MSPRDSRRGRPRPPQDGPGVAPAYEGPEILTTLLARAGSPVSAEEAARRFAAAQAAGLERGAAIPGLFPAEPHFASPEEARRLYANLFGLWDRVASGRGAEGPRHATPDKPGHLEPLPDRGTVPGDRLPPDLVEVVWKHLAKLPGRDLERIRHRFEGAQPELIAWLAEVDLPENGGAAALDLVFEIWVMLDRAFGERLGVAGWHELEALGDEPPPLEADEPALAVYVAEQLDLLAGEDATFGPAERAQVERAVAAATAGLRRTLDGRLVN